MKKTYKVTALKNGTVIDHLAPGTALKTVSVLGIKDEGVITIGMNFESKKLRLKDIIKIENKELTQKEINKIVLISPEATISIIRNFEVVRKFTVSLPSKIEGIIKCNNPNCITNHNPVPTRFYVLKKSPLKIRCHYCERCMGKADIEII